MLASDFTQCQYLTTKDLDSIPCHIPVIPALLGCVRLIAVLKIEPCDFSEIQDLRVFNESGDIFAVFNLDTVPAD